MLERGAELVFIDDRLHRRKVILIGYAIRRREIIHYRVIITNFCFQTEGPIAVLRTDEHPI